MAQPRRVRWSTEASACTSTPGAGARASAARCTRRCSRRSRAPGFRSAIGGITLPNDPSVALHRALGFEHVGTVRDAGYKHGAWHDVAFYQRRLRTDDAVPAEPELDQNGAA